MYPISRGAAGVRLKICLSGSFFSCCTIFSKMLGAEMDSDVVRYGDSIVLESCECVESLFLGIVRRVEGRRNPLLLSTEVSEADKHPVADYQWRLLPVVASKRKWGDPVQFADRIRLQMVDDKGNSRMLSVSHLDNRSVMAERRPARMESCTWWLTYTNELKVNHDGRVAPSGELGPNLLYGEENYVGLCNGARYLSAVDDQYRILRKRTVLLDDMPDTGTAMWWRIQRALPTAASSARTLSSETPRRATFAQSLSIA